MGSLGSAHSSSHQTGTAESRQISSFRINFANTIAAGERFSLTPLHVRPGGVNHNSFIVRINPPGHTEAVFQTPPSLWIAHLVFLMH